MLTDQLLDFRIPQNSLLGRMEEIKEEKMEVCFSDKIFKIRHEVRDSLGKVTLNNL